MTISEKRQRQTVWDLMGMVSHPDRSHYREVIKPQWRRCDVLRNKRIQQRRSRIVQFFKRTGKLWNPETKSWEQVA